MSVGPNMVASGGSAAASVLWRYRQRFRLTFVVKATFALVPDGTMSITDPLPIWEGDQHHKNNPMRSVRAASDLAPYRSKVDVVLVGHAFAPPPDPARRVVTRLTIYGPEAGGVRGAALIDKALLACAPQPFMKMPLLYERAYGGVGFPDNPFGVGASGGEEQPNLIDPRDPKRVAGFGPIDGLWPARKRLLGSMKRDDLRQPIIEVPDDLDWAYFQASPADQRLDAWRGGEIVELSGLHPHHAVLRTRAPSARALVRVFPRRDADPIAMALAADSVHLDTDRETCTVAWRGNIEVPNPEVAATYRIAAIVEVGGPAHESAWRDPFAVGSRPAAALPIADRKRADPDAPPTMTLADDDLESIDAGEPETRLPRPEAATRTVVLGDAPEPAGAQVVAPASTDTPDPGSRPKRDPLAQTVTAYHVVAAARVLPFREGAADATFTRPSGPAPGPRRGTSTLAASMDEDDAAPPTLPFEPRRVAPPPRREPEPRPDPPAPEPAPKAAPTPEPAPNGGPPARVFAAEPSGPSEPIAPAKPAWRKKESAARPPAPPGLSADVKQGLYGRFGR